MANYTPNYNLKKPLDSEFYNVADQNGNMDIIDAALESKAETEHSHSASEINFDDNKNLQTLYNQAILVGDWNTATKNGFYYDSGAAENRPSFLTGPLVGWVFNYDASEHITKQIVYEYRSGQGACRMDSAPGWYGWQHLSAHVRAGQKLGSAIGFNATAEGINTVASGNCSYAGGQYTKANDCQYAIGRYNVDTTGVASAGAATGSFFVIGNGSSDTSLSNAFRVSATGAVYGAQAYNTGGADYAEYFEWEDGNLTNEDRRGRLVTLSGDKISLADENSSYILGVVSANPSVIGNAYEDQWQGMYLTDVFGALVLETNMVPAHTAEDGTEFPEMEVLTAAINPNYNPEQAYIPRSDRPEWATIGMFGKLVAVDDGTCEVNGYCRPTNGGIVTVSDTGYRVIKRLDSTHVQIVFR